MGEIRDVTGNGLTAVSTFTGCGGGSLGLRWAGYDVRYASEFVPAAAATYRANFPDTPLDTRDIRKVTGAEILEQARLEVGELDLLEGSPPCASFSMSGSRDKHWGDVKKYSDVEQRVDDLFFEFVRILDELQPRVFIAENVPGLNVGVAKGYLKEIAAAMSGVGYTVGAKILDASWLGVPQARRRLIFMGMRNDLNLSPVFPEPLGYSYSISDALPWIKALIGGNGAPFAEKGASYDSSQPAPTIITASHQLKVSDGGVPASWFDLPDEERGVSIKKYAIGPEWAKMKPDGKPSEKYFNLIRPNADKPSPTITQTAGIAGAAGVTHPFEPRKFSIPELRRICGFPDDFALTGSFGQRWERLGRAVAPPVYFHVGKTIERSLQ